MKNIYTLTSFIYVEDKIKQSFMVFMSKAILIYHHQYHQISTRA